MNRAEVRLIFDGQWCNCGNPRAAWQTVHDVLAIHPLFDHQAELDEVLPDRGTRMIVLGLLDRLRLTEHGGGIEGGWLTEKGEAVLEVLSQEDDGFELMAEPCCVHGFTDFEAFDVGHNCEGEVEV